MSTFDEQINAVNRLYQESLKPFFEENDFNVRIKSIMDKFDIEKTKMEALVPDFWKKSILRRLFQVHERVLLVRHLRQKQNASHDPMAEYMYPSLCTYLLLTCFDQLGQPANGWVFFSHWLERKNNKLERDAIIKTIEKDGNLDRLEFTKKIFDNYQEIYGVKNSFLRFINEILPLKQRHKLLNQILIEQYENNKDSLPEYGSNDEKEKWLYDVRNNYTHSIYFTETHHSKGKYIDGKPFIWREVFHKKDKTKIIWVSEDFNKEIEQSILIGIAELIKENSQIEN